jgi:tetratricopeptide (TPR) repeat protein
MRPRVAALVLSVPLLFSCHKPATTLNEVLAQADSNIISGAFGDAERSIMGAAELATGRMQWLSVLKRSHRLGDASGSHEVLYMTSRLGFDAIRGAEEIAALLVFACLRTGRSELAYQLARDSLHSDRWNALSDEASLRRRVAHAEITFLRDDEDPVLDAVRTPEPGTLLRAADLFDEGRFALDAALLYASEGKIGRAAGAVGPYSEQFPVLTVLLRYDAELYEAARGLLSDAGYADQKWLELLEADILIRLGLLDEAAVIYRRTLERSKKETWIPYANLARMLLQEERYTEAQEMVDAGADAFPGSREFGVLGIEIALGMGDHRAAREALDAHSSRFSSDLDLAALQARLSPTEANSLRMRSLLWEMFQKQPWDQRTARYAAADVLADGDPDGMARFLDTWEGANGPTEWSVFLRGYAALQRGVPEEAKAYLLEAWAMNPRWQTAYDLAIIARYSLQYREALEFLRLAENALTKDSDREQGTRARVRTQIARVLYEQGDYVAARREAEYATSLDNGSSEAHLILRLLESRPN